MISPKKGNEIPHFTNNHLFPHSSLWQWLAVQDILIESDITHWLSPSEASWQVSIKDMTVSWLRVSTNRQKHSSCHRRQRALCHLSRVTGWGELVVWRFGKCLTGQGRTVQDKPNCICHSVCDLINIKLWKGTQIKEPLLLAALL